MLTSPLPDTLCPECHGPYDLILTKTHFLVKRCVECGHEWHETRSIGMVREGNYVWRNDAAIKPEEGD
jgi:Zn ribbon nucleic-acid-binding protein